MKKVFGNFKLRGLHKRRISLQSKSPLGALLTICRTEFAKIRKRFIQNFIKTQHSDDNHYGECDYKRDIH